MKTVLQLTAELSTARASLIAAKSPKTRDQALKTYEAVQKALAAAKAQASATRPAAATKTVKEKYSREETEETEDEEEAKEGEEEEEESEDDEPKKPLAEEEEEEEEEEEDDPDDSGDKDKGDDDDDDDDDDEEEEERASARASLVSAVKAAKSRLTKAQAKGDAKAIKAATGEVTRAQAGLKAFDKFTGKYKSLKADAGAATGKKSLSAIRGGLSAVPAAKALEESNAKAIARIQRDKRRERVNSMLTAARKAGKVAPAQVDHLRSQGMKDPKWLRGYLDTLPAVKTRASADEEGLDLTTAQRNRIRNAAGSDPVARADMTEMSAEARKVIDSMRQGTGMTAEQFVAQMAEREARGALGPLGRGPMDGKRNTFEGE